MVGETELWGGGPQTGKHSSQPWSTTNTNQNPAPSPTKFQGEKQDLRGSLWLLETMQGD